MKYGIWFCQFLLLGTSLSVVAQDADLEFFEKQVRPILAGSCYDCHGPDKQKADLRLDHSSFVLTGGSRGPVVVPGDLESSRLAGAIGYTNVDLQMPPKGKLPDESIAVLKEWIRRGAPWPEEPVPTGSAAEEVFNLEARKAAHWAWQPIGDPALPTVRNTDWARGDIDRFVLAKLEEAGLRPTTPAEKRTLLRRVYFDLTGMPPRPEDVEAFVADTSENALEKVVDRLLASPAFGERWARHWMDLVRYAETYGHEQDYPVRHAWQYRDYLIRAFNADVPYDQLLREHIAGDQLETPRRNPDTGFNESIIATGFWYMHQATHAPVDPALDEADRIDNQIDVMSKAFLGMTVACARCHEHKFDAVTAEDYYSLSAYLRATRQDFAFLDPEDKIAKAAQALKPLQEEGALHFNAGLQTLEAEGGPVIAPYLLTARDVLFGEPKEADGQLHASEVVFEDFEGGYDKWTVDGNAFGDAPAASAHPNQSEVTGFLGKGFLNSYTKGDQPKGSLHSQSFVIEKPYIRFLIGGGKRANETGFVLIIGENEVRKTGGRDREQLEPQIWNVREFIGQTATFKVIDRRSGGWGHVNLDHIVFTDSPYRLPVRQDPARLVAERGLNEHLLNRWLHAISSPALENAAHPLKIWGQAMASGEVPEYKLPKVGHRGISYERYQEFDDLNYAEDGWFTTGHAFGERTTQLGDWMPERQVGGLPAPGVAHSGLVSNELQGVLRSPTFTINHKNIHFRTAGRNGRIRLVVSRYELREYNGLLFGTTLIDVNTDGVYEWKTMQRDVRKWLGRQAYFEFSDEGDGYIAVDRIVFSDSPEPPFHPIVRHGDSLEATAALYEDAARRALVARNGQTEPEKYDDAVLRWLVRHHLIDFGDVESALAEVRDARSKVEAEMPDPMRVLAMTEGSAEATSVFIRGDTKSPGDTVGPRYLAAQADCEPGSGADTRLQLVEAMLSEKNSLTARVAVNRVWHHLFGRGIVPSVDNFGVLGEAPSHPELLDHLATHFRADGWSLKRLIRELMLTSTYRMASVPTSQVAEAQDPANVLLHRMNVRRLQGEAIRDSILAVSGRLDDSMYGPSVPIFLSEFMSMSRRPGRSGPMNGDLRRTVYVEVRRNFLSPMMLAFDMPLPDTTFGRRSVSNIPAQALTLMNSPFVVEQAQAWGQHLVESGPTTPEARIEAMYAGALGRSPRGTEIERMLALVDTQASAYDLTAEQALGDPRVWTDLCHVMFTLKEFIFIS